jgi:hypothetical protein
MFDVERRRVMNRGKTVLVLVIGILLVVGLASGLACCGSDEATPTPTPTLTATPTTTPTPTSPSAGQNDMNIGGDASNFLDKPTAISVPVSGRGYVHYYADHYDYYEFTTSGFPHFDFTKTSNSSDDFDLNFHSQSPTPGHWVLEVIADAGMGHYTLNISLQ